MALKFLEKGLLDRLIVCEDDDWGAVGNPHTPIPDNPAIVTFKTFVDGATKPAQWPKVAVDDVALLQYTGGTTGLPKGAMLSHGNLTAAVSIYDVWGKPARAERDAHRARDLRAAAVPHLRADGGAAAQPRARRPDLAAPALRRRGRDARHRGQARDRVSPACRRCGSRSRACPISTSATCRRWRIAAPAARRCRSRSAAIFERKISMKLKSGWGMTETCSPGTGHPTEGPEKPGSIGLMLPGIEMDVVALDDPKKVSAAGRSRRNPHHAGRTSPRATGTGRRKPRKPSSATAS